MHETDGCQILGKWWLVVVVHGVGSMLEQKEETAQRSGPLCATFSRKIFNGDH